MELRDETVGYYTTRVFTENAEKEALVYVEDGRRFSYRKLQQQADMVAKSFISIGIKKGEHVALVSCNSPEWIITFLACLKVGAVCVCINYLSTQEEIDYMLRQSEATILIVSEKDMIEKVDVEQFNYLKLTLKIKTLFNLAFVMNEVHRISDEELQVVADKVIPADIAVILYTSGTTGNPKGILYNHKAILNGPISHIDNFGYTPKDNILAALPLNHILGGLYTVFMGLYAGCKVVLMKNFKTSVALKAIEEERCTGFHGVPTMYQYLINKSEGHDFSSLRVGMISGGISSPTLLEEVMDKLHVTQLNNTFGQTETLGVTQTAVYEKSKIRKDRVGKPVEYVEIKICDPDSLEELPRNVEGELWVKSPYTMMGYYKNYIANKNTIVNGWIRTGDVAFIDEDGFVSIKGRIKDLIIRGGENISPSEIEHCLLKLPKIENAIIVGVPDKLLGEEIFAFIKPKDNTILTKEEILEFLVGKIAKYKYPKYIEFINTFPLTSTGKIKRNILQKRACQKVESDVLTEVAMN